MANWHRLVLAVALLLVHRSGGPPPRELAVAVERLDLDARQAALIAEHDHTVRLLEEIGTLGPSGRAVLEHQLQAELAVIQQLRAATQR